MYSQVCCTGWRYWRYVNLIWNNCWPPSEDPARLFYSWYIPWIQSLPTRTAFSAVYLVLWALHLEAEELHKRQLSLLFSIVSSSNRTLYQLVLRAIGLQNEAYIQESIRGTRVIQATSIDWVPGQGSGVWDFNLSNAIWCSWQGNGSIRSMLHIPWRELTLKTLKALNTLE